jgi:toxin-antitoxin system PIN domain toxin
MTCIADANVLFPLLVQGHAAHQVARLWWEEQPDGTVGTCLLTRLAVLRLLTNKIAMNGMPVTPDEAVQAWRQLQNDPRSLQIEAEPINHEPRFVALVSGREPTPNLWTDAWLAALALSLDYEMATFDRGFKSFRGLKLRLLTALEE